MILLLLLLLVTSGIFRPHTRVFILEALTHMSQLSPSVRLPHPESGGGGKTNQPG